MHSMMISTSGCATSDCQSSPTCVRPLFSASSREDAENFSFGQPTRTSLACAWPEKIDDYRQMNAGHARHLRQIHRAEFSGADQPDAQGFSGHSRSRSLLKKFMVASFRVSRIACDSNGTSTMFQHGKAVFQGFTSFRTNDVRSSFANDVTMDQSDLHEVAACIVERFGRRRTLCCYRRRLDSLTSSLADLWRRAGHRQGRGRRHDRGPEAAEARSAR